MPSVTGVGNAPDYFFWLIGKREQKIDVAHLRITHMVIAFAVLSGLLQWKTEGTVFGFVESKLPGFGGEGGRGLLEG